MDSDFKLMFLELGSKMELFAMIPGLGESLQDYSKAGVLLAAEIERLQESTLKQEREISRLSKMFHASEKEAEKPNLSESLQRLEEEFNLFRRTHFQELTERIQILEKNNKDFLECLQRLEKETPVITLIDEKETPVITVIDEKETPVITVIDEKETPEVFELSENEETQEFSDLMVQLTNGSNHIYGMAELKRSPVMWQLNTVNGIDVEVNDKIYIVSPNEFKFSNGGKIRMEWASDSQFEIDVESLQSGEGYFIVVGKSEMYSEVNFKMVSEFDQ